MKTVWQEAMTSKKVLLTLMLVWLGGCTWLKPVRVPDQMASPYQERQIWAVAPLRNETGSQLVNTYAMADKISHSLENVANVDVLPVNRTLAAMQSLKLNQLRNHADVMHLLRTLDVDALVVGTMSAYNPYDPPKIGLQLELYVRSRREDQNINLRDLSRAATSGDVQIAVPKQLRPISVVSAYLDASDPAVNQRLRAYARSRGQESHDIPRWRAKAISHGIVKPDDGDWRLYRISMDLYAEFVSYEMCRRLVRAESNRLASVPTTP